MNGTGSGYFTYRFPLPQDLKPDRVDRVRFVAELSAKELLVKDMEAYSTDQDFMRGSRVYPSANPNAYPMTDETRFPSEVIILVNGTEAERILLIDDPADHRGVLSWHHQLKDRKLREAGSYGYLVEVPVSEEALASAQKKGFLEIEIRTAGEGGVAVYGKEFGRYPLDPSLVINYR
jgi:predicted transcriptional regulator